MVLPERFISELCYLPEEFVSLEAKNTDVRAERAIYGTKIGLPWDCRAELTHPLAILYTVHALDPNIYWARPCSPAPLRQARPDAKYRQPYEGDLRGDRVRLQQQPWRMRW